MIGAPDPIAVEVEEVDDGWTFALVEGTVTQLRVDHAVSLLLENGEMIRLESAFTLTTASQAERVPPGDDSREVQAALLLLFQQVMRIRAESSARLVIEFLTGDRVDVEPGGRFENWQITLPGGQMWVGLPGGGIQHFR